MQFHVGEHVVLKKPKNAKAEVAVGKIIGIFGNTVCLDDGDKIIVPVASLAVKVHFLSDKSFPLHTMYPGIAQHISDISKTGSSDIIVLWPEASTRRAQEADLRNIVTLRL